MLMNKGQVQTHINLPTPGSSTTDGTTLPRGKPITLRNYGKTEQIVTETYRIRGEDSDGEKELIDHRRSVSEGRLLDR
jgi:hypothetical protein